MRTNIKSSGKFSNTKINRNPSNSFEDETRIRPPHYAFISRAAISALSVYIFIAIGHNDPGSSELMNFILTFSFFGTFCVLNIRVKFCQHYSTALLS